MSYPQLRLDNQLCHRLYLAANAVVRTYRPMLSQLDLTYPQYVVMMALWEQDNISIKQLAVKTGVDLGALTLILQKLGDKRLLSVQADAEDKRQKRLFLCDEGRALADQAAPIPERLRCQFSHLKEAEIGQLVTLLDKLNVSLCSADT